PGLAATPVEHGGGAEQTARQIPGRVLVAAPERAHPVAGRPVPFSPSRREVAELIAVRAEIPWLGDQLYSRENRILPHRIEEHRGRLKAVALAAERGGEIEAKAVHMAFLDPV